MAEIDFPYTYEVLDDWGETLASEVQDILLRNKKRTTGGLIQSIDYNIIENKDGTFDLELEFADYGKYVLSGRRAGARMPPVSEIEKWIKNKGFQLRKNAKQPNQNVFKTTAFLIARGIAKNGIKPLNFIKPFQGLDKNTKFQNDLAAALSKDMGNNIQNLIKNI